MTTLKDLLNDFAEDILKKANESMSHEAAFLDEEDKETIIEEYIEAICKRWVGQE